MNCFCQYDFNWLRDCPGRQGHCLSAFSLYYPLRVLYAEVKKRTSYIGRHRSTDTQPHLLDEIAFTDDECDLFDRYAQSAMADVFDVLQSLAKCSPCAYLWDEGKITISMQEEDDLPDGGENENEDAELEFIPPGTWIEYQKTDGTKELYISLQGCTTADDIHDTELFELQPVDYRHSVHYVLSQPDWMVPSIVYALDVAVFEALVYDIMYLWFLTAFPSEAEAALMLYTAQLEKLKKRLQYRRNYVSYIIPRPF